jgi:hypothetical protein
MSDLIWLSDAQVRPDRAVFLAVSRYAEGRRIHTRYDRCAHTFKSAICIAAAI